MTLSEEEEEDEESREADQDDYVDVVPAGDDQEDYIDVPQPIEVSLLVCVYEGESDSGQLCQEEEDQENYEDTTSFQSPPPPPVPPPPSKTPGPSLQRRRPDPPVDTTKIYIQPPNGISLHNVYVALWDFAGSARDELSVQRGDLVHILDPDPQAQWWAGEALDESASTKTGAYGFLPASYFMTAFEVA